VHVTPAHEVREDPITEINHEIDTWQSSLSEIHGPEGISAASHEWIGEHDFNVETAFCKKCGMSEMEFHSTMKSVEQHNRIGELVGIVWYGGRPCKF
jgi:hypothetical protein